MSSSEVVIDDKVVEGFVFFSSFVLKQCITSIRTTLYYPLIRGLRVESWDEIKVKAFSKAFLAGCKRLKASNEYIPSKDGIDLCCLRT